MLAAVGTAVEPGLLAPVESGARWILAGLGGAGGEGASFRIGRWLFLRSLGAVHLAAFLSLWLQVDGLFGSRGIVPARDYLATVRRRGDGPPPLRVPTLFWMSDADAALHLACGAGVVFSVLLLLGVAPAASLVVLWALYLSFAAVGRVFLSYQWDVLLLEASLLALLVAPWGLSPGTGGGGVGPLALPAAAPAGPVPAVGLLLLWWLLFRLVFQSGVGKLTSGDDAWRRLDALAYHWWTQPLPAWTAWYVARLPRGFHRAATLATHVLEIGFPLLLFGPRDVRLFAVAGIVLLQLLILLTGNYNFFNLLTIALAFLLVDDAAWSALLPGGLVAEVTRPDVAAAGGAGRTSVAVAAGAVVLAVSGGHLWRTLRPGAVLPGWLRRLVRALRPFRSVNSYGLFRVMTRRRPEILVQGSLDGRTWKTYEFRWKPGDPKRRPRFCQPHQPRLDWQMWFAALDSYRRTPWLHAFLTRLLEGSEPVRALLAGDPFPERAPRYVRAELYEYRFTDAAERRRTGRWWERERIGRYAPVLAAEGEG